MGRLEDLPERLLLDGGMGTALSARGLDTRVESSASWNLRRPAAVRHAHQSFVAAGAGALHTNTFTGNPGQLNLPGSGPEHTIEAANRAGVELARAAAIPGVLVIGDIGPTGRIPPPEGNADLHELEDSFLLQAATLAGAGVDMLHLETFYHPKEARAALRGCRLGAPGVPVIASMACRRSGDGYVTVFGLPWEAMLLAFLEEGADAVGTNCSMTPEEMAPLIERLARTTRVPIVAQPTVAPTTGAPLYPGEFACGLLTLLGAGARAVGGCCGTSAADLAAARLSIDALPQPTRRQRTAPIGCSA